MDLCPAIFWSFVVQWSILTHSKHFDTDEDGFVSLNFNHVLHITGQTELKSEINSESLHLIFDRHLIETWKSLKSSFSS